MSVCQDRFVCQQLCFTFQFSQLVLGEFDSSGAVEQCDNVPILLVWYPMHMHIRHSSLVEINKCSNAPTTLYFLKLFSDMHCSSEPFLTLPSMCVRMKISEAVGTDITRTLPCQLPSTKSV